MLTDHLANLFPDRINRIQCRHRILKDDRDLLAAQRADLLAVFIQLIHADFTAIFMVVGDGTAFDAGELRQQSQNGVCRNTLAAAALAHNAQRFPSLDVKADAAEHLIAAAVGIEINAQILHAEGHIIFCFSHVYSPPYPICVGSLASRRPSPIKLIDSTNNTSIAAHGT